MVFLASERGYISILSNSLQERVKIIITYQVPLVKNCNDVIEVVTTLLWICMQILTWCSRTHIQVDIFGVKNFFYIEARLQISVTQIPYGK